MWKKNPKLEADGKSTICLLRVWQALHPGLKFPPPSHHLLRFLNSSSMWPLVWFMISMVYISCIERSLAWRHKSKSFQTFRTTNKVHWKEHFCQLFTAIKMERFDIFKCWKSHLNLTSQIKIFPEMGTYGHLNDFMCLTNTKYWL